LEFIDSFIGKTPKSLIFIPNYIKVLNKRKNGNLPKLIINNKFTVFVSRKLEEAKQYNNTYKDKTYTVKYKSGVQRLYLNKEKDKYLDFIYQKNGIFYIGNEKKETYINEQGFPLPEYKIADANGKLLSKNIKKIKDLEITNIQFDKRSFNPILETLIKEGIDIENIVVMPSSVRTSKKIDWIGNKKYLDAIKKIIINSDIKHVIPIGTEALKAVKSLNEISFATFQTDFYYPYQFGSKTNNIVVTFVENPLVPGFEKKTKKQQEFLKGLHNILKDNIVVDEEGIFENLYSKKKKKEKSFEIDK